MKILVARTRRTAACAVGAAVALVASMFLGVVPAAAEEAPEGIPVVEEFDVDVSDVEETLTEEDLEPAEGVETESAAQTEDEVEQGVSTTVDADPVVSVPTPTITGTVRVGSRLTARTSGGTPDATVTFQWRISGKDVPGATGATFTPKAEHRNKSVSVRATAAKDGYQSASATSQPRKVAPGVFTSSARPTISGLKNGRAQVGTRLTAQPHAGRWSPKATFSYRWFADGKAIKGATSRTYTPKAGQHRQKITVRVTAERNGYTSVQKTSKAAVVSRVYSTAPRPKVVGTARVGQTLRADVGSWSPKPASFSYQWKRDGKPIKNATGVRYKVKKADHGKRITVTVTAKRSAFVLTNRTSRATDKVRWPVGVSTPKITSRPQDAVAKHGERVTFSTSATGGRLTYQWQRRAQGGTWVDVKGKTSRSLTVKATSSKSLWEYRVVVSNMAGTKRSRPATLIVNSTRTNPFPANRWYVGDYWLQASLGTWHYSATQSGFGQATVETYVIVCGLGDADPYEATWELSFHYYDKSGKRVRARADFVEYWDADCGVLHVWAPMGKSRATGGTWRVSDDNIFRYGFANKVQWVAGLR